MAHEMSHAILQHAAEEISHSRLLDMISIGLVLVFWAILPTDLTAALSQFVADRFLKFLFELPFSRQLEKEADTVGLDLAARVRLFTLFSYFLLSYIIVLILFRPVLMLDIVLFSGDEWKNIMPKLYPKYYQLILVNIIKLTLTHSKI